MRAIAIISFAALALALCVSYAQAQDICSKQYTCSTCFNSTGSNKCGWCSDTNLCMAGTSWGPTRGSCNSWHKNCVGVSIPTTTECTGSPMTVTSLRRLMGGAGTNVNLTNEWSSWNYQTRQCSPFTGCTDWKPTNDPSLPKVSVTLHIVNNVVYLNFLTATCPTAWTCYDSNYQVTDYSSSYGDQFNGYGMAAKVDMTTITQKISPSAIPSVSCSSVNRQCRATSWRSSTWTWDVTLTDSCFRIATNIGPDPEDPTKHSFLELTGKITYP